MQALINLIAKMMNTARDALNVQVTGSLATEATATIANGESLSGAVDLNGESLWGIIMPSAWTTAVITFSVSNDNVTYYPLRYNGSEHQQAEAAASVAITIDPVILNPGRYVKVRSGTSASAVAQGAERVITLLTKPL